MRVGMGYDVHRLTEDRDLILGGVKIDWEKGLLGHSDADVLIHQLLCGKPSNRFCVLTQSCQPWLQDACKSKSVIACNGNIIWYSKSTFVDFIDATQCGEVIRIEDTGRRIFQIQKL